MKKLSLVSATRKVHRLTGLRASLNFEHNQATTLQAKLQIGEALNFRRLIFLVERCHKKLGEIIAYVFSHNGTLSHQIKV